MTEIPVYLITGFLESGKTNFIRPMLTSDDFAGDERTLFFRCENGEEEYDEEELAKYNVVMIPIKNKEDLTQELLKECGKKYKPEQVVFEYNGMWPLAEIEDYLPRHWVLYQIVTTIDATTFDAYVKNMGSLMMEKLGNADMIIFNRCTPELAAALRKRNLKMINRRAEIYLEYPNGDAEDYFLGDECPFDLSAPVLELSDEDYGFWYVDVMEHPDRYDGKMVRYRGTVARSDKFPKGSFVAGRFAMVCCSEDVAFFGMICKGPDHNKFQTKDWVTVTARVKKEYQKLFQGEGPVLYTQSVVPCEPPEQEIIGF